MCCCSFFCIDKETNQRKRCCVPFATPFAGSLHAKELAFHAQAAFAFLKTSVCTSLTLRELRRWNTLVPSVLQPGKIESALFLLWGVFICYCSFLCFNKEIYRRKQCYILSGYFVCRMSFRKRTCIACSGSFYFLKT